MSDNHRRFYRQPDDEDYTPKVKKSFYILVFLLFISPSVLIYTGMGIYDYYRLKYMHEVKAGEITELKNRINRQREAIEEREEKLRLFSEQISKQHRHIGRFSDTVQTFKAKLDDLMAFEQQIRSNIDDLNIAEELTGIGGESISVGGSGNYRKDMIAQLKLLDRAVAARKKGFESIFKHLRQQRRLLASTPTLCPIKGFKTSGFGFRISPFTGLKEFHKGLDIAARIGTEIRATGEGEIVYAGVNGTFGKMIEIDHGNGIVTRYAHAHKILKKRGTWVKKGDVIARVGNTGRSTGSHLHYEVRMNSVPVDPELYISKTEKKDKLILRYSLN